jgi:tetratricopeptide (TPR) repeat protein
VSRLIVILGLLSLATSNAQTNFLIHTDPADGMTIVSVRSMRGPAGAQTTPVTPASELVIVIAMDSLSHSDVEQLKPGILNLYNAWKGGALRLGLLQSGTISFAGPFATRALLAAALKEIQSANVQSDPLNANRFYSQLPSAIESAGTGWPMILIAGKLPPFDPDVLPYARAYIGGRILAAHQRISYWNMAGGAIALLDEIARFTGGVAITDDFSSVLPGMHTEAHEFADLKWQPVAIEHGFLLDAIELLNGAGQPILKLPFILSPAGAALPDLEQYAALIKHRTAARRLLETASLPAQTAEIRTELEEALRINSRDWETLETGASFYDRAADPKTAAEFLDWKMEIHPDAPGYGEIGHRRYLAGQFEAAEKAHLRARELGRKDPAAAEELARIYIGRGDPRGAVPFLDETLAARPADQPLWFLRADTMTKLKDWKGEADSLEHAVSLGGDVLEHRARLTRLALDHNQLERAGTQVDIAIRSLPDQPDADQLWAGYLEELHRPDDALTLWRRTVNLDPKREPAHYAVARLLSTKGDHAETLKAAEAGLDAAPRSARLLLIKAEALQRQDRLYEARLAVREFDPSTTDAALLRRAAEYEDLYGHNAPHAWRRVAETAADRDIVTRGLLASLRDGDMDTARWFTAWMTAGAAAEVAPDLARLTAENKNAARSLTPLPGGREALTFVARGKRSPPAAQFFAEYARILVANFFGESKGSQTYLESIRDYFAQLHSLMALGSTDPATGITRITFSPGDRNAQKQTESALNILGWKVVRTKDALRLESDEKSRQAQKQDLASALAIDQVGMQSAFSSRKPYSVEIVSERIPVLFDEAAWKSAFWPKEQLAGGLAEAMARNLNVARVYVGLNAMDPATAQLVAREFTLSGLAQNHADTLMLHGSSLAIEEGAIAVPGGTPARAGWRQLTGADPAQPAPFLHALFEKGHGELLAYFATLAQLDRRHQQFFTANPARLGRFFELFRDSPEMHGGAGHLERSNVLRDFFRELPLDDDGSVDFPGSAETWMVLRGKGGSVDQTGKVLAKVRKKIAPDLEDDILLRLLRASPKDYFANQSSAENFLALVRIDARRGEPMDEKSAILLSQHYVGFHGMYPYFSVLTGLGSAEFEIFFRLAEKVNAVKPVELNPMLGHVDSLIEMLSLAVQAGSVDQKQAAKIFLDISQGFLSATGPADWSRVSLDAIHAIAGADAEVAGPLRKKLIGQAPPVQWKSQTLDAAEARALAWDRVLEEQKVPSLDAVAAIVNAAAHLSDDPARRLQVIETNAAKLPEVTVPKDVKLEAREKQTVRKEGPEQLMRLIGSLRERLTRGKKTDARQWQEGGSGILALVEPQMRLALSGTVYAFYFRPDDLVISDDPLLLRKHQFVSLESGPTHAEAFAATTLETAGAAGTYLTGTFAHMSAVSGVAASTVGRGTPSEGLIAAQIGSIRSTHWAAFRDEDQRIFGLRVRAAREWIVAAGRDPKLAAEFFDQTTGILSINRRRDLAVALDRHDWPGVWNTVTLSDLHSIGARITGTQPAGWKSPVLAALRDRSAKNSASGIDQLGQTLVELRGSPEPRLLPLPPYEEIERQFFPVRIAERMSELKLYFAEYLEREGFPAAALGVIAEPAAQSVLRKLQLSDARDWPSALAAFDRLNDSILRDALEKR